ncbi:MAG: translation initiation factor IF-3 [Kofleriaceae bacterium]
MPHHGLRQVGTKRPEEAAGRKRASTSETKEIKFRPKTDGHDMDFKVKHIRRFLEEGNKVRLAVVFRGREITHRRPAPPCCGGWSRRPPTSRRWMSRRTWKAGA